MSFTTYVTTWNVDPLLQIQDMINNNIVLNNTRIVLAFASFNFDSTDYIPGFGSISMQEVQQMTNLVHSHGARISLSIGGATFPFYGSDLYTKPGDLANNINQILIKCGFDGVDFDIEDQYSNVPSNFSNQAGSLINTLRSLNSGLYISLTTAAQAWATGCYQQQLINLTIGNLNAWQPMEYDIWIQPGNTYAQQIQFDIKYYMNTWFVNPSKIVLGLMPGKDDTSKDLTLQDAIDSTTFAVQTKLQGVMTWDDDLDAVGIDGNAPYAYSREIQNVLIHSAKQNATRKRRRKNEINELKI